MTAAGNISKITDSIAVQTQTFGYDALNRLTSAQATGGTNGLYNETYGYNATTGNLSSKAGDAYSYGSSAHPHAATQQGTGNFYAYDSNGNMTTRTIGASTYTLGYDAEGRLTTVSGAATASFVYDGDSQRVKSTINGTTIAYIGAHAEWNVTDQKMTRYYLYGSERIAMKTIKTGQSDVLTYVLADHLGSASVTTNSSGVKQSELRYRAWGETRYTSGSTATNYRFTGQREDPGLGGLMFYNARWYDPSLNQWAQPDTIIPDPGNVQDWDRYSYTRNNPLRYTDPTGHFTDDQILDSLIEQYQDEAMARKILAMWSLDDVWMWVLHTAEFGWSIWSSELGSAIFTPVQGTNFIKITTYNKFFDLWQWQGKGAYQISSPDGYRPVTPMSPVVGGGITYYVQPIFNYDSQGKINGTGPNAIIGERIIIRSYAMNNIVSYTSSNFSQSPVGHWAQDDSFLDGPLVSVIDALIPSPIGLGDVVGSTRIKFDSGNIKQPNFVTLLMVGAIDPRLNNLYLPAISR